MLVGFSPLFWWGSTTTKEIKLDAGKYPPYTARPSHQLRLKQQKVSCQYNFA